MEIASRRSFRLRIVASPDAARAGQELDLDEGATIGRDQGCDVVLSDISVSRRHARVESAPGGVKVVDLGSGNGVWIGSRRVREADLGPGDQFRIGSTLFECQEGVLAQVEEPGPDETHFIEIGAQPTLYVPAPPARADIGVHAPEGSSFVLRVAAGSGNISEGTEFVIEGEAIVGRSTGCTVVLDEPEISRRHARIERVPGGFSVTDLGSTGGIWIGDQQIDAAIIPPGQTFRLGTRLHLECLPMPAATPPSPADDATRFVPAAEEDDATRFAPGVESAGSPPAPAVEDDGTRFVAAATLEQDVERGAHAAGALAEPDVAAPSALAPASGAEPVPASEIGAGVATSPPAAAAPARIEDEGELVQVDAHRPFLLDDPQSLWYVESGGILLFTVAVQKGEPTGTRTHFMDVAPGRCFFGFDFLRYGFGSGFLAVAKQGTAVRRIAVSRLQQRAARPDQAAAVAGLVDAWVEALTRALARNLPARGEDESHLEAGKAIDLGTHDKATSAGGVVWVDLWNGSALFDGMSTLVFPHKRTLIPITPDSWIQPLSDEFGDLSLKPLTTREALGGPDLWAGLEVFHQVLCECEFVNKRLVAVDEFVRLQQKAERSEEAEAAAYDAIGSVMRTGAMTPPEFLGTGAGQPLMRACAAIGHWLGIDVKEPPGALDEKLTYEDGVAAIATASGFRTRVVVLRDDWWNHDHGPLLAQIADTRAPVAILPTRAGSYDMVDPATGTRARIRPALAATLAPFAFMFYRPFPDGGLSVREVIRFGATRMSSDFRWVVATAVVIGVVGTITPYLTGQLFDSAIPQADRSMLFGFGAALMASAIGNSLFKITQGIATVRMQTHMGSSIQTAVWDRILNLPTTFFRKYQAGDLADRANGVEAIQQLFAGAGVAAILGSVSGLFYVVQMFAYDLRLALLALVLTVIFVGLTVGANYLQLRQQRREMTLRGRIAGLVLNLISGVSKLRIAGAEQHAFRVWAQQFATQRKISFTIGNIQNLATTFSTVFPVLSSIAIFVVMLNEQEQAAAANQPGLTTGEFIAFTAAFGLFLAAMQSLGDASLNLLRIVPIYERLKPILETAGEVDRSKAAPGRLKGEIELSHLYFRYNADGPWIINDLSLKIKAGEFVAFVGASGCGKSTLMRLMLGFEQASSGSIYLDGQDLGTLDMRMVRQQMGVVLQVSRVMPTEIYRNILGIGSGSVQDAWDAAEKAGLAEDIRAMPMGMHTYVSEGGGTLSGGQRQRLMIARAIVHRPKVLFLDEATSALDNRAQAIVTESMDKLDATRIVIAHRLSTVIGANKICYLENGRMAEMGTYQELMEKDGLFAQLAKRQVA
jgi:NHLM bacteriocin system ABC transporter ATP-binding protein